MAEGGGADGDAEGAALSEASEDQRVALSCLIFSQEDIGGCSDEENGADGSGTGVACGNG